MSTRKLRIGILGTRGIPNRYGGFEQCAEYLALGLTERGHEVWVYNSSAHEYREQEWRGIHIVHCYDPEVKIGTAGQFIYDLTCINDARRRRFDIALQLGYTSSSVWWWRWPRRAVNIVNMDGLEWKRSKYSAKVQRFLKMAERWAAKHADVLVADSIGIQAYLKSAYGKDSHYIPYGAPVFDTPDLSVLDAYSVSPGGYYLLIARMEPENNIEMIIEGVLQSKDSKPLLVIGNTGNEYGKALVSKYSSSPSIRFAGAIYDTRVIDNLRYYAFLYFHGHSVGGTNPSLLEAMGCSALIAAHNNDFNRAILEGEAFYFNSAQDIPPVIDLANADTNTAWRAANKEKIRTRFSWVRIVDAYEALMLGA